MGRKRSAAKQKSTDTPLDEAADQPAQKKLAASSPIVHDQAGSSHSSATSKKPPSPYILYYNEHCKMDLDDQGRKKKWTRSARIELAEKWKKLSKKEKDRYVSQNAAMKVAYEKSKNAKGNVTGSEKRKAMFDTRCNPSRFREMLDSLGTGYDASIREIGFGGLLFLKQHKLKRPLCHWLVEIFDCDSSSFTLGGRNISVSADDIARVLGIASSGVPPSFDGDDTDVRTLCERFNLPIEAPIKLLNLEGQLKEVQPESDEFKAKFMLYTLGRLLCPGSDVTAHRKYVLCLKDDALRGRVNWAEHVYEVLIDGIQAYQQAVGRTYVSGCLLVLQVLFLDHVARGGQRDVRRLSILPRIGAWGETDIQKEMRRNRAYQKLNDGKERDMSQHLRSSVVEGDAGGMQLTSILRGMERRLEKLEHAVKDGKGRHVAVEDAMKDGAYKEEVESLRIEFRTLNKDVRAMLSHMGKTQGQPQVTIGEGGVAGPTPPPPPPHPPHRFTVDISSSQASIPTLAAYSINVSS